MTDLNLTNEQAGAAVAEQGEVLRSHYVLFHRHHLCGETLLPTWEQEMADNSLESLEYL